MSDNKAFIITALRPWSNTSSEGTQALAREMARTHRVLYVNPPSDVTALLRDSRAEGAPAGAAAASRERPVLRRAGDDLWVFDPPIIINTVAKMASDALFDVLNRYANRRYAEQIEWARREVGIGDYYLLIDNDLFRSFYLPELLDAELTIYLRGHRLPSLSYWKRHGERLEPRLVEKCDAVLTPSQTLADEVRGLNANAFNIGQGADVTGYDYGARYPLPADMEGIPRPVLGMTGPLGALVQSPDLIGRVAEAFPQCSVVLVGGEDAVFSRHALHRLPNVYFLGPKRRSELAAYVAAFDVCLHPEVRSQFTAGRFQEKVVRYLALGKSVVATATDAMSVFMRQVGLAVDDEHFLDLVAAALLFPPDSEQAGRYAAFSHTFGWERVAERLFSVVRMLESDIAENIVILDESVVS